MAILISGTTIKINKVSLDSLYCRISVKVNSKGDKLDIFTENYSEKNDYKNNKNLPNLGLKYHYSVDYDRDVDGGDILDIAHDYVKTKLELAFDLVGSSNIKIVDI